MRIITRRRLVDFWTIYPPAEGPMRSWETAVKTASWTGSNDVKRTFRNADWVYSLWVFDINRNRLISDVKYELVTAKGAVIPGVIYIKHVFTHPEYDKWSAAMKKLKGK